jgi:hypothetical protein
LRQLPGTAEEIACVTASLAERITKFLCAHGLGPESDPEESDPLARDQPWLAGLYAASVMGRTAFGPNAGRRATRTGDQIDPETMEAFASPRCANVNGFSLHANVALNAADRQRLERLMRYCARPPVAIERLESLPDGRVLYRLKRAWRNGTTHVVFQPQELLEKLSALIPAPRAHMVRYSGVFAPAAAWRSLIVPDAASAAYSMPPSLDQVPPVQEPVDIVEEAPPESRSERRRNYSWAQLMRRVFLKSKVEQLDAGLRDHDVAGFQVTVRHALAVRFTERIGNLYAVCQKLIEWKWSFEKAVRKRLAFQILHHHEVDAVRLSHIVNHADIGVIQRRNRPRLASNRCVFLWPN